jgi:predicted outer membrane repeat protein
MAYDQSKVTINSVLEANFAGGDGGGLASADESTILIENGALFRKNHALGNGGGVLAAGLSATIGDLNSHAPYFAYLSFP